MNTVVVTAGDGYRLGETVGIDAAQFDVELARAWELLPTRTGEAAELLARALDRWRGRPGRAA